MGNSNAAYKGVQLPSNGVSLRKRTGKACDQCRRRKTKCNGSLCCKACVDLGLECSYGHKLRQSRGPAYVAFLEERIKALEREKEELEHSWIEKSTLRNMTALPSDGMLLSSSHFGSESLSHRRKFEFPPGSESVCRQLLSNNFLARCPPEPIGALKANFHSSQRLREEQDQQLATGGASGIYKQCRLGYERSHCICDFALARSNNIDQLCGFESELLYTTQNGPFMDL